MDFFLLLSAIAFGIGAAGVLGRVNWLCAGFCFYVLSRLVEVMV
jgi:hypothetical protein